MAETESPQSSPSDTQNPLLSAESPETPTVSVVLPTMNEEVGVVECITKIKQVFQELDITGEVVVSDSSADRTPELAREMGAIVVQPDELGYGYAYRYAFERARGEYIVIGDADTTYDFMELPALLEPVLAGEADIVLGSRLAGDIKPGAMPFLHRTVGNPLLTKMLNLLYDTEISDAHSGFRVISREALDRLEPHSDGMEFASEMLIEAAEEGLRIAEVPITYHEREGEATLDTFRDGWRHVRFMLVNSPGYLFHGPGLVFGLCGVILISLALFDVRPAGQDIGIHSMLAGSLLTLVGYQLVLFGLLTVLGGNPIREPRDTVTRWLLRTVTLERSIALGGTLVLGGVAIAGYLVFRWVESGFSLLPSLPADIVAFTLIVLGIQTIFNGFFASILADDTV